MIESVIEDIEVSRLIILRKLSLIFIMSLKYKAELKPVSLCGTIERELADVLMTTLPSLVRNSIMNSD